MSSYKQNQSIRELPNRKVRVTFPGLDEASGIPNGVIWDALDDLQSSNEQLHLRAAALQAQNKDLEAYAHMAAHDLKDPLTVMIMTSDVIVDVPDLTRQELNEYMKQIRSTAYEMNSIINNLLLFAERGKAESNRNTLSPWCISQFIEYCENT
jgi:signal transduction histidine kinase